MNAPKTFSVPPQAAADAHGMNIAIIRLNMDPADKELVNIGWLPDFFAACELRMELRTEIVRVMRLHADVLENGSLDKRMAELQQQTGQSPRPIS
jgi:hypothetical protein